MERSEGHGACVKAVTGQGHSAAPLDTHRIWRFGTDERGADVTEGTARDNQVLGGKGANLAEMARLGLPVPPGFTITCQTCMDYARGGNAWPAGTLEAIDEARADLERRIGKRLGDARDPLLVSVRSGAPISMPGMMDTVLDLGLNDASVEGLAAQTGDARLGSEERRVGKECESECRSRWSPYH